MHAVSLKRLSSIEPSGAVAPGRIRPATLADLTALVAIEQSCFESDRLSRRSFRHLLTRGNAAILVDASGALLRGYVTLLFRGAGSLARVYSIATTPVCVGQGIAAGLLHAAELRAIERHCTAVRLEIRADNLRSQHLFLRHGYRPFGTHIGYYKDGMDAIRFKKDLAVVVAHSRPSPAAARRPAPTT